ncbi:MAG: DNA polymerase IV [Anaerolineae bacterium]|nr:DNA polymerase IV [Anaerolineae bacterium]MDK1081239.1 DNA polymerase IV [Anaerolineae bacterium]MDK1117554.1 DNA polymerase IV [Anaerolineae bacterium]
MSRTILHLDLDAFFCAVEENKNPALRNKAFAVGGKPNERGVVASCSYAARKFGVRSAMPISRALRLCPGLIIISSRHAQYSEASKSVMEHLYILTSWVEKISIDEAFLDISELTESPERIALGLQAGIRDELGLPSSIGIASNKLMAKIATEVGKKGAKGDKPPFALTIVPQGKEAQFLAPLPAEMLWGVGPKTGARLKGLGIGTIGDIASWPEEELIRQFGEYGRDMAKHAQGRDDRPVVTEHEIKSISQEVTFSSDIRDDKSINKSLVDLSAQVGRRLRKKSLAGTTIKLKIRWPDFKTLTRQTTLPNPTNQEKEIKETALKLLKKIRKSGQAVRLIGVGVTGLGKPIRQLELWQPESEKERKLQEVLNELKDKFGVNAIKQGN